MRYWSTTKAPWGTMSTEGGFSSHRRRHRSSFVRGFTVMFIMFTVTFVVSFIARPLFIMFTVTFVVSFIARPFAVVGLWFLVSSPVLRSPLSPRLGPRPPWPWGRRRRVGFAAAAADGPSMLLVCGPRGVTGGASAAVRWGLRPPPVTAALGFAVA